MHKKKCKITLLTWRDEEWSADKETLDSINKMIKKDKPLRVKWVKERSFSSSIGDKIFLTIGWIAMSPFVLQELVIMGYRWVKKKIKK